MSFQKNENYNLFNPNNQYINTYSSNTLQNSYEKKKINNNNNNNISNYELRKIIKEEFESQIIPYKNEIQKLKSEINNFYINDKKDSIENLVKDIRLNYSNCVNKKVFEQKIGEIEAMISINNKNNDMNIINSLINEINKINSEIKNIKNSINSILEPNINNQLENITNKDRINPILNLNEIKSKDIKEINKIQNEYSNEIKIDNEKIEENNINQNIEHKINEIVEKFNLTKLSNLDIDKLNMINETYDQLVKNYLILAQKVKNQNNSVNSLLTKLNSESKVKNNLINQDGNNDLINNKYEYLEKQIQYLNNQTEQMTLDLMNIKDLNINLIINEIKNELEKQKDINIENKMIILQNQTGIKSNEEKLNTIEDKNHILEKIIIKLNEEKIKNLENKIINMDKNLSQHIIEEKKLEEINNEITENYKRNDEQKIKDRFKEIENKIKNMKDEIFNANFDKIEDGIDNNRINNDSKNINKLKERISKLEEEKIIFQKEIENLKQKSNSSNINEINNDFMNIIEDEKKEKEKKEDIKEIKNEEEKKELKESINLPRELIDSNNNENKKDDDDDEINSKDVVPEIV